MFGRRIFLLGAAYFMVGFTRPSGAAESRTLVAFLSRLPERPSGADAVTHATASTGNVEEAAKTIGALTGADLYAIRSSRKYPVLHRQNSIEAKKELDENARPPLSSPSVDLSKYSTVFIGFPIWWYQEPMIVRSFLEKYDWQGKTVIPFCVSMEVGIDRAENNIKRFCRGARVLSGRRFESGQTVRPDEITAWLKTIQKENE